jgi:hypothetical protein
VRRAGFPNHPKRRRKQSNDKHVTGGTHSDHPLATILGDGDGWLVNRLRFALAMTGALFLSACGFFGPGAGEEVRQQPRRNVYRSADENPPDEPIVVGKKEKVPGE